MPARTDHRDGFTQAAVPRALPGHTWGRHGLPVDKHVLWPGWMEPFFRWNRMFSNPCFLWMAALAVVQVSTTCPSGEMGRKNGGRDQGSQHMYSVRRNYRAIVHSHPGLPRRRFGQHFALYDALQTCTARECLVPVAYAVRYNKHAPL